MPKKNSRRTFLRSLSLLPFSALVACRSGAETPPSKETVMTTAKAPSKECKLTGSDVEGPFHIDGAPSRTKLTTESEVGTQMWVSGRVVDENCVPVSGASLDIWQADHEGKYHDDEKDYRLRGQIKTDEKGAYKFETIRPGRYMLGESYRPAHIHFIVSQPGFTPLTTQLYFEGDEFLRDKDPCGNGCNASDPSLIRPVLIAPNGSHFVEFEIVLKRT